MRSAARLGRVVTLGICALVASLATRASADISNDIFTITATNANGTGSWTASSDMGWWDPVTGYFHWDLPDSVDILDDSSGAYLGSLDAGNLMIIEDPQVSLNFAVSSGGAATNFTITSALLSFPPIIGATGAASVGMTLTANSNAGATLNGLHASGGSYLAQYNGLVPGGTTFADLLPNLTAGAFGTTTTSSSMPFQAMGGAVNDISSQFSFTLSANASASGTSIFIVVPAPGALALLGVASLFGVTRRRRV